MSSSFSSSTQTHMQTPTFLSSSILSSSILSFVPSSVGSSASVLALASSEPLRPFPSPSPSIPSPILPSTPSPTPTEPSPFSSPLPSSESSLSSVISSRVPFAVASSTNLTTSSSSSSSTSLGTALSESNSAVANNQSTLRPVEITAIVVGTVTAVLGITAVLLVFCFRRKRHHHHPLYGLHFAEKNKGSNETSRSDVEARETPSGRSYFHSLYEQKGTTPLLQNSVPNDLPHHDPYKDTELTNRVPFPVANPIFPPQSSPRHEISTHLTIHPTIMQNAVLIRPPRSPPPLQSQQNLRPLLTLTIPEFIAPNLMYSAQGSDAQSRAEVLASVDGSGDTDGDSPSIYSQPSTNALSRGPSVSSHISVRQFSVPLTVLESIMGGGSPSEENIRYGIDAGSEDGRTSSGETITSATRGPTVFSPPNHGPDLLSTPDFGLVRQDTAAVASLLKFRQRRSELLPIAAPSDVSHIERVGSIRTAVLADAEGTGVGQTSGENNGMDRPEPYGRRFRRMKAEQANSGMVT